MLYPYELIWYNYIAQEDQVEYILAKNEDDAMEIACMYIRKKVGHDNEFAKNCISSLTEAGEIEYITRDQVEGNHD